MASQVSGEGAVQPQPNGKPSISDDLQTSVGEVAGTVSAAVDASITVVARALAQGLQAGQQVAQEGYNAMLTGWNTAQECVGMVTLQVKEVEDAAVGAVKDGLGYASRYPYTAYPAMTTAALLVFPGTRRMLWRLTFGRFATPESIMHKSQSRVELLNSKLTDYNAQIQKLEERARLAEQEFNRSYHNLRGARLEFQRLASQVAASQKAAQGVLRDLRDIKKVDDSLALRGQAASQVSTLKSQLTRVNKEILRIAKKDI